MGEKRVSDGLHPFRFVGGGNDEGREIGAYWRRALSNEKGKQPNPTSECVAFGDERGGSDKVQNLRHFEKRIKRGIRR